MLAKHIQFSRGHHQDFCLGFVSSLLDFCYSWYQHIEDLQAFIPHRILKIQCHIFHDLPRVRVIGVDANETKRLSRKLIFKKENHLFEPRQQMSILVYSKGIFGPLFTPGLYSLQFDSVVGPKAISNILFSP